MYFSLWEMLCSSCLGLNAKTFKMQALIILLLSLNFVPLMVLFLMVKFQVTLSSK